MVPNVSYLGHRIDENGPFRRQVKAVLDVPSPQNVRELKLYLLPYYGKFLPDLSSVLAPLYQLLRKDMSWCMGWMQCFHIVGLMVWNVL